MTPHNLLDRIDAARNHHVEIETVLADVDVPADQTVELREDAGAVRVVGCGVAGAVPRAGRVGASPALLAERRRREWDPQVLLVRPTCMSITREMLDGKVVSAIHTAGLHARRLFVAFFTGFGWTCLHVNLSRILAHNSSGFVWRSNNFVFRSALPFEMCVVVVEERVKFPLQ